MTTITRRGFALGLGAMTLASPRMGGGPVAAAEAGLTGYVVASGPGGGYESTVPGLTVIDLAADTTASVDVPPVDQLLPIWGGSYGIAAAEEAIFVLDAATATATEIAPFPGTTFTEPLASQGLYPPPFYAPTQRFAFLSSGVTPTYLVDLERATALDLTAAFARADPFFQAAAMTPDGALLLLGTSETVVLVSPETGKVERTLAATAGIRSPQLSPGGTRAALVEPTGRDRRVALRVADVDRDAPVETPFEDASGSLSCRWITDDALLLTALDRYGSTVLTRLDLATGETTGSGVLPGTALNLQVIANGTRAITSTDLDATVWWLIDLEKGNALRLPDLDDMLADGYGPAPRSARAVLFGPDDYSGMGVPGQHYAVLNTATGAITTTVDRVEGRFYGPPVLAPDGRTAAIGGSDAEADELWLLDLVTGDLVAIPDHLGAEFAPDGRHILTRGLGKGQPLEIRDLADDVVRELGVYDFAWWLGAQ